MNSEVRTAYCGCVASELDGVGGRRGEGRRTYIESGRCHVFVLAGCWDGKMAGCLLFAGGSGKMGGGMRGAGRRLCGSGREGEGVLEGMYGVRRCCL